VFDLDGIEVEIIGRAVGASFAVLVAEERSTAMRRFARVVYPHHVDV
jgi:hypothetical protein